MHLSYRKISLFLFFISLICVSGTKKSILSLLETILMVLYIIFVGLDTRLIFEQIVTTAIILCSLAVLIGSVYVSVEVDSSLEFIGFYVIESPEVFFHTVFPELFIIIFGIMALLSSFLNADSKQKQFQSIPFNSSIFFLPGTFILGFKTFQIPTILFFFYQFFQYIRNSYQYQQHFSLFYKLVVVFYSFFIVFLYDIYNCVPPMSTIWTPFWTVLGFTFDDSSSTYYNCLYFISRFFFVIVFTIGIMSFSKEFSHKHQEDDKDSSKYLTFAPFYKLYKLLEEHGSKLNYKEYDSFLDNSFEAIGIHDKEYEENLKLKRSLRLLKFIRLFYYIVSSPISFFLLYALVYIWILCCPLFMTPVMIIFLCLDLLNSTVITSKYYIPIIVPSNLIRYIFLFVLFFVYMVLFVISLDIVQIDQESYFYAVLTGGKESVWLDTWVEFPIIIVLGFLIKIFNNPLLDYSKEHNDLKTSLLPTSYKTSSLENLLYNHSVLSASPLEYESPIDDTLDQVEALRLSSSAIPTQTQPAVNDDLHPKSGGGLTHVLQRRVSLPSIPSLPQSTTLYFPPIPLPNPSTFMNIFLQCVFYFLVILCVFFTCSDCDIFLLLFVIMGIFSLYYNRFSGSCIYLTCVCVIKSLCAVYVDADYQPFIFTLFGIQGCLNSSTHTVTINRYFIVIPFSLWLIMSLILLLNMYKQAFIKPINYWKFLTFLNEHVIWVYYIVIYIVTLCTIPNIPSLCSLVLLHFIITCHLMTEKEHPKLLYFCGYCYIVLFFILYMTMYRPLYSLILSTCSNIPYFHIQELGLYVVPEDRKQDVVSLNLLFYNLRFIISATCCFLRYNYLTKKQKKQEEQEPTEQRPESNTLNNSFSHHACPSRNTTPAITPVAAYSITPAVTPTEETSPQDNHDSMGGNSLLSSPSGRYKRYMNILSGKKPLHQQSQAQLSSVQFNENIPPLDGATDSESPLTKSSSFEMSPIPDLQNSPIPQENNQFMNNNISPLIDSSYDFSILKLEFFYYYYALLNFLYSYSGYMLMMVYFSYMISRPSLFYYILYIQLLIYLMVSVKSSPRFSTFYKQFIVTLSLILIYNYITLFSFFDQFRSVSEEYLKIFDISTTIIEIPEYSPRLFSPLWLKFFMNTFDNLLPWATLILLTALQYICKLAYSYAEKIYVQYPSISSFFNTYRVDYNNVIGEDVSFQFTPEFSTKQTIQPYNANKGDKGQEVQGPERLPNLPKTSDNFIQSTEEYNEDLNLANDQNSNNLLDDTIPLLDRIWDVVTLSLSDMLEFFYTLYYFLKQCKLNFLRIIIYISVLLCCCCDCFHGLFSYIPLILISQLLSNVQTMNYICLFYFYFLIILYEYSACVFLLPFNLAIPSIQMAHYIFFSYIDPGYMTYPLVTFLLLMIYKQIDYESREEQLTPTKISISFELFNNPTPSLLTSICKFVLIHINSITMLFLISTTMQHVTIFSVIDAIFTLFFFYKPDRLKPNSIVLYIFNLLSYIQLAISIIYQFPLIPEQNQADYVLLALYNIFGYQKYVYKHYEDNPTCSYIQAQIDMEGIPINPDKYMHMDLTSFCLSPFSKEALLPLIMTMSILYIQHFIYQLDSYKESESYTLNKLKNINRIRNETLQNIENENAEEQRKREEESREKDHIVDEIIKDVHNIEDVLWKSSINQSSSYNSSYYSKPSSIYYKVINSYRIKIFINPSDDVISKYKLTKEESDDYKGESMPSLMLSSSNFESTSSEGPTILDVIQNTLHENSLEEQEDLMDNEEELPASPMTLESSCSVPMTKYYVVGIQKLPKTGYLDNYEYQKIYILDEENSIDVNVLSPNKQYALKIQGLYKDELSLPSYIENVMTPSLNSLSLSLPSMNKSYHLYCTTNGHCKNTLSIFINCFYSNIKTIRKGFSPSNVTLSLSNRRMIIERMNLRHNKIIFNLKQCIRCELIHSIKSQEPNGHEKQYLILTFQYANNTYKYLTFKDLKEDNKYDVTVSMFVNFIKPFLPVDIHQQYMDSTSSTGEKEVLNSYSPMSDINDEKVNSKKQKKSKSDESPEEESTDPKSYTMEHIKNLKNKSLFHQLLITFRKNSKWYQLKLIEYIFLAYFYFYLITHINVFSLILLLLYFLYGSIYVYTLPNGFLNISILVLYVYIVLKFCLQSEFIYQYVNEQGYYYFSFEYLNETSPIQPNSFQYLYMIGLYKTNWNKYVVPVCSEIGYDVALVFFFIFYKLTLKNMGFGKKNIIMYIYNNNMTDIQNMKSSTTHSSDKNQDVWLPKFVEVFLSYCSQNVSTYLQITLPSIYTHVNHQQPTFKYGISIYTITIIVQMFILIFSIFSFSKMNESSNVKMVNILELNYIQSSTLVYIVIQILLILADRIFYSNKLLGLKVIYHYLYTIIISLYIFLYVPLSSNVNAFNNTYLIIFYILQLVYVTLSSIQIKYGYPSKDKTIHNLFNRKYNMITRVLYFGYEYIPFFFELHCILDFFSSKTTLDIFSWFRLKQMEVTLILHKARSEWYKRDRFKVNKIPRNAFDKTIGAGTLFVILIFALLLPLILFSSDSIALKRNYVNNVDISLYLQTKTQYIPLYEYQNILSIEQLNATEYKRWQLNYLDETGNSILTSQWADSSQIIKIPKYSSTNWLTPTRILNYVIRDIQTSCESTEILLKMKFHRSYPSGYEDVDYNDVYKLDQDQCQALYDTLMLNSTQLIPIHNFAPSLFHLTSTNVIPEFSSIPSFNASLTLEHLHDELYGNQFIWILETKDQDTVQINTISDDTLDDTISSSMSSVGLTGIIGLYAGVIYTIGRLVRNTFIPKPETLIYFTLDDPLPIINLINAITLCRINKYRGYLYDEFTLYNIILRVFSSPEILLHLSQGSPVRGLLLPDEEKEVPKNINDYKLDY